MKKVLICLQKIEKDYISENIKTPVLKGITLNIHDGDFIAITGPSGSGKSTLMNIIGLLDTPTRGKYVLHGKDVTGLTEDEASLIRNKEIGFVFQSFNLLKRISALDNVMLPAIYAGISEHERRKKSINLLTTLGLSNRMNNKPNQLSGGQQQKVAIARALMNNPSIILADEPTGNLDTKSGEDVMRVLKDFNQQGKTIVLITHESNIANKAKKIIHIQDGQIVQYGN